MAPQVGQSCTIYFVGGRVGTAKVVRVTPKQFVVRTAESLGYLYRFWRPDTSGKACSGRCRSAQGIGVAAVLID